MLKGNLATRPFYNERLVSVVVALAIIAGIALTAFNAITIYRLSGETARHKDELARTHAETERVRAATAGLQQSLDRNTLFALGSATREANALIDKRTFSWTVFFGMVEKTLPLDVRLLAVSPQIERGEFRIQMLVNAKSPQDLEDFIGALMDTGAFYDLLPAEQQRNDDGTYTATLAGVYLARTSAAPADRKGTDRP
jgi:hypothetical protein